MTQIFENAKISISMHLRQCQCVGALNSMERRSEIPLLKIAGHFLLENLH